jgi:signal transduction histidine kinase
VIGVTFQSVREAFEFEELTTDYMDDKTEIIMDILQSLSKTIDNFRFFYSQDEGIVDFDVKEIISSTVYTIQSKLDNAGILLKQDICGSCMIKGNKGEFSQVLLNLLNNAYDVLVDRKVENPLIEVKLQKIENKIRLTIFDNAGGVNAKIEDKIFELYISTKKNLNNTGIGLYIAKLIIERHMNGKLYFNNRDAGAEFVIEL